MNDPECFYDLLQFYDGICSWEEDSATPVLHIGWVKPIVKCFLSFEYDIRSKVEIRVVLKGDFVGANTLNCYVGFLSLNTLI